MNSTAAKGYVNTWARLGQIPNLSKYDSVKTFVVAFFVYLCIA